VHLQLANSKSLDWTCLGHVVRVEKEAAGDIRLNMKLFRACVNDQKKFCKGVEPGHMRVQVRAGILGSASGRRLLAQGLWLKPEAACGAWRQQDELQQQ
jgi:hypothetical protein